MDSALYRFAHEFSDTKNSECVNTVQSTFHKVIYICTLSVLKLLSFKKHSCGFYAASDT